MQDPVSLTGTSTDEGLIRIAAGCSLACPACPHDSGRSGSPWPEVLSPGYPLPLADRVSILAGDLLRSELAPLVERLRVRGVRQVVAYAHSGIRDVAILKDLAAAGLTGLDLSLPAASRNLLATLTGGKGSLTRAALLIDAANALGLDVSVEIPLSGANCAALADTFRRILNRVSRPEAFRIRFVPGGDGWHPGLARDSVAGALVLARIAGVPVSLGHKEAPPPCILDLPVVSPDLYPELKVPSREAGRPFPVCVRCPARTACFAGSDRSWGTIPSRPVSIGGEDGPSSAALFLRHERLSLLLSEYERRSPRPCRFPWEQLEGHDVRGTVTPCAGGWPRPETVARCTSWHGQPLIAAWNSPGMREIRRAMATGRPLDTCKPDCPTFHGGPATAVPPRTVPCGRRFFDNLVANLEEMLAGAEELRSRPLSISFSPTLRCVNRCRMCDIHEARVEMGDGPELHEMPDALFDELSDLLHTTRMLALTGGEPLLSRRMVALLQSFDADRFPDGAVTITTNGLLLREPLIRDLSRTRIKAVFVSINAATAGTYEAITGTRGGFERVLANVARLRDAAPRMAGRPAVIASFVVMRSNWRELPAFLELVRERKIGLRLLPIERDRCGESIFTDVATIRAVLEMLEREVRPRLTGLSWSCTVEVARLESIIRGRLERGVLDPL